VKAEKHEDRNKTQRRSKKMMQLCQRNVRASYVQGSTAGAAGSISSHPYLTLIYAGICWR